MRLNGLTERRRGAKRETNIFVNIMQVINMKDEHAHSILKCKRMENSTTVECF
jgi:hypothetical protein